MKTTEKSITPHERTILRLAKLIARDVFEIGDEPGQTCTRIQFKAGEWPGSEVDTGGLCESSLVGAITHSLRKRLADEEKPVTELLGFDPTNHHNAAFCPYCNPERRRKKGNQ